MTFLKLLLSCGTIFIVATAFSTDENVKNESDIAVNRCFPNYIIPEESDITLIPYINIDDYDIDAYKVEFEPLIKEQQAKSNFFYGVSITVINIIQPTRNITFHLWKSQINRLLIKLTRFSRIDEIQQLSEWHYIDSTFTLVFEDELKPENYTLTMKFLGTDNRESFCITTYINETGVNKSMVTGDLEKIRARYVFPCPYELRLKSQLTILIKYDEKYLVLSNIPAEIEYINRKYGANDMVWTKLRIASVMSTYFMAIPISDFASYSYNVRYSANINMWCRRHMMQYMNFAWNVAKNVTTYLEYILHAKNLENVSEVNQTFVVIPNFQEEDTSIRGLVFLREEDIIYEESDHTALKIKVARLITRTVIYKWLGSMQFSINAGLMMFLEAYVIDKSLENSRIMDLFVAQNQHESLHLFSDFNMDFLQYNNISKNISHSPLSNYFQIPFIIRMLQHLITDEVFSMGIREYIQTHALNSTNLKDFWVSMQVALEESDYRDMFNVTEIMNNWTNLKHYPIVMIQHYGHGHTYVGLQNFVSHTHNWSIPVTFASQSKPDFAISLPNVVWLRNVPLHVRPNGLEDDDWIIANLQQAGYYRINYDTENWARIAKYLNSRSYKKIHVLNRAQIIDDAFHLATEKKLNISIFWNLVSYLSRDTDYIAWYPMIKALEYMSSIFPFPDKRVQNIKDKMNGIFGDLLTWTGYIENSRDDDFTKYLKQELAKWACNFNHSWCMEIATRNLELHLHYPEKHKVLPWLKEWTYCKGLMSTRSTTWKKVMNIWMEKRDNKILEFLACSQNITIIKKYLLTRASKMKLQDNENIYSFHSIIAKYVRNNEMLNIITSYFLEIKPRRISTIAAIIDIINHMYSEQQLVKVSELMQYTEERYKYYIYLKIKTRLFEIQQQMYFLEILSA